MSICTKRLLPLLRSGNDDALTSVLVGEARKRGKRGYVSGQKDIRGGMKVEI